jgi:hypothetical protein
LEFEALDLDACVKRYHDHRTAQVVVITGLFSLGTVAYLQRKSAAAAPTADVIMESGRNESD